jgi:RecA-family ATPase
MPSDNATSVLDALIQREPPPHAFPPEASVTKPSLMARWPDPIDLEKLAASEPDPPEFIIADWLPVGVATGIWGHGGVGKSYLGLMLAVCIAAGVPFLGMETKRRRVTLLSCEDRVNVLHWRLARICTHLGMDLAALRDWLNILDLVGHDSILWTPSVAGACLTAAYGALSACVEQQGTEILIVDGISDTFDGDEIKRGPPKRFVNALLALIPPDRGAIVLLGHVDKASARNPGASEGYSGNTAWHNAVRARWYLYPQVRQADEAERAQRTGELVLELQKTNHGRDDCPAIRLAWDPTAHVFAGKADAAMSHFDRAHQERQEEAGIVSALRACAARAYVPAASSGRRTAYNVLRAAQEFPDSLRAGKPAARRFWRLLEGLRHRGDIVEIEHRGKDRHIVKILVPAESAGNANACA